MRLVPKYQPDVEVSEHSLPRILHVEDDPTIARAIAKLLSLAGYEVTSCATAEHAIELIATNRFDVIVSDFNLAGQGTGADVLLAAGETPFIFLSGDDRADDYGVRRLDKPCTPSALREAIAEAIELDECADCGASTAVGSPDPHECLPKVVREMPLDGAFDFGGAA